MSSSQASEVIEHLRRAVLLSDGAGLTDGQLLEDFVRRRDEAALAALVRRHGPMVWGVCRRVLGSHQDAEDAFQVTFLVLVRKAACVIPREMVANWLYGVAHQTALKARATNAKRRTRERQVTVMPEPAVHDPDLWDDLQPLLDQELSRLPDKYRVAIVLCDLEGKSYKEAARQLGVPAGTLSARLTRGRAMLAKRLTGRGLTVTGASLATVLAENAASASAPASVVTYTIKAASLFAAGEAATVVISAKAAALMEGVLTTMLLSKLKTVTALVLVFLTCAGGALAYLPRVGDQTESGKIVRGASSRKEARDSAVPLRANFPDLAKIDRSIARQPKYKATPYYALLAIGPEAKKRVWLVVDGEVLYVDRNGNGDLTEANERVALDKKIQVAPGMYKGMDSFDLGKVDGLQLRLDFWVRDRKFVPKSDFDKSIFKNHEEHGWEFATLWRINADGTKSGQIPVCFCRRPRDAQICHLGGRLTFALRMPDAHPLVRNAAQNTLNLMIGTPGLPARNWREPVFAPLGTDEVPGNVHPVAKFEFPHKDAGQPPIKVEAVLNKRCCGDCFYGPVRLPADAGKGKVKVTVSIPGWKEGKVVPATFEVPIAEMPPVNPPSQPPPLEGLANQHSPDRLPLGTVCAGATVEASFMLLAKGDDPKKVALKLDAPRFVRVLDKSVISRDVREGKTTVKGVAGIAVFAIDTSKPGVFEGEIKAELGTTTTRVPVSVIVKPADPTNVKLLVVGTPFDCYSTHDASVFKDWTDLVAQSRWDVNYLIVAEGKPVLRDLDLSKFGVILLAEGGLVAATADDIKRVRVFVEQGGRLVVTASHFFSGTIQAANKVLDSFGLKMLDVEAPFADKDVTLTRAAFAPEIIKGGIRSARFYRASPIAITAGMPARVLVKAAKVGGPGDAFIAAAKAGKGEVVALGQSLWWSWIHAEQAKGSDNAKLLRLLLGH